MRGAEAARPLSASVHICRPGSNEQLESVRKHPTRKSDREARALSRYY